MDLDLISKLCLGAVNGGVKFCMLACDSCTVGTHTKKVDVVAGHVYINTGRNAAYTNPHLSSNIMGPSLSDYLGELQPREDWLVIFQSFTDEDDGKVDSKPLVTPKKRKHRYVTESLASMEGTDALFSSSWDLDSSDAVKALLSAVQTTDQWLLDFQLSAGEDVDTLFSRVQEIKEAMGSRPSGTTLDTDTSGECTTIWEMFTILRNMILDPESFQSLVAKISTFGTSLSAVEQRVSMLTDSTNEMGELIQLLGIEQDNQSRISAQALAGNAP
jgi:hypothetical protein